MIEPIITILQASPYFTVLTAAIALASAIAALTPTPKAGTKLAAAYKILDFLALNIGKAKDKGK